ncbi:MAG: alpha/beta hydrolase [Bradymonadaceae bacterium]|nr:alpha/beta hydrolase [Lujinxingiaceae bacterium]
MCAAITKRNLLVGSLAVGGLVGLGLGVFVAKRPLTLVEWYLRGRMRIAGLEKKLMAVEGGQLAFFTNGRAAAPGQPTVVLVHGLGGSAGDWSQIIPSLSRHPLIIPELAGHGDSQCGEQLSEPDRLFETFCAQLDHAMASSAASSPEKLVLVGNSLGGWLALHYAVTFPERVARLILVNSAGLRFDVDPNLLVPENREQAQTTVKAVFGPHAPKLPDFVLDAIVDQASRSPTKRYIGHTTVNYFDERLSEVSVPTDIIWGMQDPVIPLEHARRFADEIPNARLHCIEGCGHSPQVGNPREFARLLRELLAR